MIPQKSELEEWIEYQIKNDPKISTDKLAKLARVSVSTIKRRIAKHGGIIFIGSGFSGHWEITKYQSKDEKNNPNEL